MGKSRKKVPVSTCCCCKSQKRGKQFSHRRFRRCERMVIKSGETFLPIKQYELTNQWDLGGDGKTYWGKLIGEEWYERLMRK